MDNYSWIPNRKTVWLIYAVLAVSFTGIFAVVITLARIPAFVHLFTAASFYRALCVHVVFAMLIWLVMFLIFIWHQYFLTAKSKWDWLAIVLGIVSIVLIAITGAVELGLPYLNDYMPVVNHPVFWIGILMFIAVYIFSIFKFAPQAIASFNKNTEGQLLFYTIVISAVMLIALLISFFVTSPLADFKLYLQRLFWVPGHIQQFLNASILLLAWHYLVRKSNPGYALGMKNNYWLKLANGLLLVSIFPMLLGLFVDPVLPFFKLITIFAYGIGLGVPVLVHTIFLLRSLKGWSFASTTFIFSIILYYAGVFIAYGGMKSDLRVTAHYHGVVTALTVALMGMTYFALKEYKLLKFDRFARLQPAVFTIGMIIIIVCLFSAGHYGAPRKTFGFSWIVNNDVIGYLNILAFGAGLSFLGGIMYIFYSLASFVQMSVRPKPVIAILLMSLCLFSFRMPDEAKFLGQAIADIQVFDAKGNSFLLSELIKNKPAIISPIYTKCPHTCSPITANLQAALKEVEGMGKDYNVITFSFDKNDKPEDLQKFDDRWALSEKDWKVLSAKENEINKLLKSMDFDIEWSEKFNQFEHPNVVMIITPSGKISRYVYGINPKSNDLKIALLEAKKEMTSLGIFEGLLLRCFIYDPATQSYVLDRKFILMLVSGSIPISGMLLLVVKNMFF